MNTGRNVLATSRRRAAGRGLVALLSAVAAVHALSTPALAQRRAGRPGGPATQAGPAALPVQPFLDDFAGAVEGEIVALMQQRAATGPDALARLELQIDLRVVARWMLAEAAEAPPGSEPQCSAYLRAIHLLGAASHVAFHSQRAGKPTPQQADAMAKLHDLTFRLGDGASVRQADELCRNIGHLLVTACGPPPPGVKELTLMRPPAPPAERSPRDAPATLAELSERVKGMAVSAPLRQQLIELAQAAERAEKAPAARDPRSPPGPAPAARNDAAELAEMLRRAVALADSLQKGLAVGEQGRARLEAQLTEGLALFTDPRLRSAGAKRVNALDQYRRTVERIRGLNLTPAMQKRLAPAFVYAQENPEDGRKVIEALEAYLDLSARYDARPPAAAGQAARHDERGAKLLDELAREFGALQGDFIESAASLGRGGGAATPANPEALEQVLARMRAKLDLLTTVEKVPRAQQLLNTYRPKPFGALERRVTVSMVALSDPKATLAKDDAAKFLSELVALAGYAGALGPAGDLPAEGAATAAGIPAEVVKTYTGGRLAAFEGKCRELVSDQVNQLAAGRSLESAKTARLDAARSLISALREAADLEGAVRRADVLARWADWSVDAASLQAVLAPYREAVAASYAAFADDAVPPVPWATVRARYGPVIDLLRDAGSRADACGLLPAGVAGELSKLVTPLGGAPFATERFASLGLTLWGRYAQATDDGKALAAAHVVSTRLRRQ